MLNLVTDRTLSDVEAVKALRTKVATGTATAAELAEWNAASLKGAYNYTDLNRVGSALLYIQSIYAEWDITITYATTPKTDWTRTDVPSLADITHYLDNVAEVAELIDRQAPTKIQTVTEANAIESILLEVESILLNIVDCYRFCGDTYLGG